MSGNFMAPKMLHEASFYFSLVTDSRKYILCKNLGRLFGILKRYFSVNRANNDGHLVSILFGSY